MNTIRIVSTDYSGYKLTDINDFGSLLGQGYDIRAVIEPRTLPINIPTRRIFADTRDDLEFFRKSARPLESWESEYHKETNLLYINNAVSYLDSFTAGCNFTGKIDNGIVVLPPESLVIRPASGGFFRRVILRNAKLTREYAVGLNEGDENENQMQVSVLKNLSIDYPTCLLMPYEKTFPWTALTDQYLKLCILKEYLGRSVFEEIVFLVHASLQENEVQEFIRFGVKKIAKIPPRSLVTSPVGFSLPEVNISYGYPSPKMRRILRRHFLGPTDKAPHKSKRLYVPRDPPSNGRNVSNSAELRNLFESLGFETLTFEKLNRVQQAVLFAQANVIIFVTGSAAANLVFSSAKVLELSPKSYAADEMRFYSACEDLNVHNIILSDHDIVRYQGFSSFVESMYFSKARILNALAELRIL